MSDLKQFVEEKIVPATAKLSENKVLKALTSSMMATMPLSLGTSLVAILAFFPIPAWTAFLTAHGITAHANAVIGGTTQIMALFLAYLIGYNYTKLKGKNGVTGGVITLGSFLVLMPQVYQIKDGPSLKVFQQVYLGSSGIFVAILVGILVAQLYVSLENRGFTIKFPDSVPDMISQSLSPTFIAMIIFLVVFGVRVAFGFTAYGNVFDFVNKLIAKPVMHFGSSIWALVILYAIANLFWCFGIHPSSILSVYVPVLLTAMTGNIEAYTAHASLPYLAFVVAYTYIMIGGTGSTLGLAFDMLFFSRSSKFKALGKVAIIPNIFNINEPLIFGTPILFNPIFFVPMFLTPFVNGGIAVLIVKLGAYASYNPTIKMPWTMPNPITHLLQSGVYAALGVLLAILATAILYYPFFKVADRAACKEEAVA